MAYFIGLLFVIFGFLISLAFPILSLIIFLVVWLTHLARKDARGYHAARKKAIRNRRPHDIDEFAAAE